MTEKERSYAKHAMLSVKDWDAYQNLLRNWNRLFGTEEKQVFSPAVMRKN